MLTMNSRGGGAGAGSAAAGRPTGRNARLSKAVMAKVDRVMEVCSVPFDEAHRVLQDNGMDVQRTIERFVSGEEEWNEVSTKKKKPAVRPSSARGGHTGRPHPRAHDTGARPPKSYTRGGPRSYPAPAGVGGVLLRRALAPFAAQLRRVAVVPPGQAAMHWQRRQAAVQALIWRVLAWRLGRSLRRTRRFLLRQAVTMQNPHLPTAGVPRRSVEASKWGPMPLRLRIRQRQRGLGVAAPPVQLARQCRGPRLLSTTRPRRLLGCHMPRLRLLQSGGRLRSPRRRLAVRGLAHRPSLCHQRRHPRLGWRP